MNPIDRLKKLFEVSRDRKEIELWVASLVPLMVAFVYFVMLMLPVQMTNKDITYVVGVTAGFTGLQTYWIMRGWRRNEGVTVVLGIIGICIAIAVTWFYINGVRNWLFPAY